MQNFKNNLKKEISKPRSKAYFRFCVLIFFTWVATALDLIPAIPLILVCIYLLVPDQLLVFSDYQSQERKVINEIQEERKKLQEKIEDTQIKKDNIFDFVRLNLNQITEYYTINKSHAQNSFKFSVIMTTLGFVAILASLFLGFFREEASVETSIIIGVFGVISEFIGGINFFLYQQSSSQSNIFLQKLIRLQNIMLAIELMNSVEDTEEKSKLMEKIITSLIKQEIITTPQTKPESKT